MDANDWYAIGIVVTIILGWLGAIHKRISSLSELPVKYVPRQQLDARFYELERRWERETQQREDRMDKRFDAMQNTLDRILAKLDEKADK